MPAQGADQSARRIAIVMLFRSILRKRHETEQKRAAFSRRPFCV
jgi:hypothetical protein